MGLDMYAYSTTKENVDDNNEFIDRDAVDEFYYWRKHHDLHGWMERLYRERGGNGSFNCEKVKLTNDDLDALETAVKEYKLPHTEGFFFGNNPPDKESVEYDLQFIERARQELASGRVVFYDSWW